MAGFEVTTEVLKPCGAKGSSVLTLWKKNTGI
jgi:hypothetical protein